MGEGVNGHRTLFKMIYDALHFHTGSLKIKNFKVLSWKGGKGSQKKSTLLIMLTIMDESFLT